MKNTIRILFCIVLIVHSSCRKDLVHPEMKGSYDYTYSGIGATYTDCKIQGNYGIKLGEKKAWIFRNGKLIEKCKISRDKTTSSYKLSEKKGR